jgi:glutaredoxin
MSKKVFLFIFIGLAALGGLIFFFIKKGSPGETDASDIILFSKTGCPYCAKVEEYVAANNVQEKVKFKVKNISLGINAKLLEEKAKICGIPLETVGVPFLWDGSKCIMGDEDIINFFKEKIGQ